MLDKRSQLPSALFLSLSEPAAEALCQRAMASQPRFVFEVANAQASSFCSSLAFEASLEQGSLIDAAMAAGHLSLGRLLFRKRRLAGQSGGDAHFSAWVAAMESNRPDHEILKSRSWTRPAPAGPRDFIQEATWAFAMGRPLAGLCICKELLASSPLEIESLTRRQPTSPHPALAGLSAGRLADTLIPASASRPLCFEDWSRELTILGRREPSGKPFCARDIAPASLIEHLCSWAGAFEAQSQRFAASSLWMGESARELNDMARALWLAGAHASPEHYARLFEQFPLRPDSPQILFLREQSESFQLRFLAPAWIQACASPHSPCGDGILWDKFQEAHAPLKLALDRDPFALRTGSQTPAAWSMLGDMSLTRLGVERGFDPSQSDTLLMPSAVCAQMLLDSSAASPLLHHEVFTGKHGDLFLGRPGLSCVARAASLPPSKPGLPIIKTTLASMAAALGRFEACSSLCSAGCEEPAVDELFFLARKFLDKHAGADTDHHRQRLDERQSACEAFILGKASAEAPRANSPRRVARGA